MIYHSNMNQKKLKWIYKCKTKLTLEQKKIIIVKKGHFIITHIDEKSSIRQRNPDVYALKHKASKYMKKK